MVAAQPELDFLLRNHKITLSLSSFYRSKSDGLWWVRDNAGHGGSTFKVYRETKNGLEWYRDADQFGDFIVGKHKGPVGKFIPWTDLGGR